MSLLEKLKSGTNNVRVVKFPGTEEDVAVRVLSNQELQDAVFAAERLFDKSEVEIRASTLDAYEDERTTQILWRALREPGDPGKPFAQTVAELRSLTSKEEKEALVREYQAFEQECSPSFKTLSDEEFEELFEVVKKNVSILSSVSSLVTLRGLIAYLASPPATSRTDSGSISSP